MDSLPHLSLSAKKITPEELARLFELCSKGDADARERIITAYLPYVLKICSKYEGRGVPSDDLFQEGAYGLILALDKFDFSRGAGFASFATPYIEKYIKHALISQSIYCPIVFKEDFFYEMQRYIRALDEAAIQLNERPSDQEMARRLHTTENKIRTLSQYLYSFFPLQDLVIAPGAGQLREDGPVQHHQPEDAVLERVLDLSCLHVVLSAREKEVLSRRFGFTDSGVPEDISSISKSMGLAYETIRATYNNAIQKLRCAAEKYGYTPSTICL